MRKAISTFSSEAAKKDYVQKVEERFEHELDEKVAEILFGDFPRILLLSGPSCAGKTTMANKLVSELAERGKHVQVISLDDFFFSRKELAEVAKLNGQTLDFDSPAAIDQKTLAKSISEMLAGTRVTLPVFDFKEGKRTACRIIEPDNRAVFLLEGIQAVYPEVTSLLAGHPFRSIFVSVETGLMVGDTIFAPEEIRFFRRLVRDFRFRGATPEFTFFLWDSVRKNELVNILPYAPACDMTFNTVIDYEIGMLKPHLLPLLSAIPESNSHFSEARRMLLSLEGIDSIDEKYLPTHAMYHEFLG